jgi:hypothetical protein
VTATGIDDDARPGSAPSHPALGSVACRCPNRKPENTIIKFWIAHDGLSGLGKWPGLDIAEAEELAEQVPGLEGLAEAGGVGIPVIAASLLLEIGLEIGRLRNCPKHGQTHRWVTERHGEFLLSGSVTTPTVERVEAPLWPLKDAVFRTAIHASTLLLADQLTPEFVRREILNQLAGCRGVGEALEYWERNGGEWSEPVPPKVGMRWPEKRILWHGCGRTTVCGYCLTRRRWRQFEAFWTAARRNIRASARRLAIHVYRLPTAKAKRVVRRSRTVSARVAVPGSSLDWVLTVAPMRTVGEVVTDPASLWTLTFEPVLTKIFADAAGQGWSDDRVRVWIEGLGANRGAGRDFQLKDPRVPSAETLRSALKDVETSVSQVTALELDKGGSRVAIRKTVRAARNRRYRHRRAAAGYLCREEPFDDVSDVRLGLALDLAETKVGPLGHLRRPVRRSTSKTIAIAQPHPSAAVRGPGDGIILRVLPVPRKPGAGLHNWKAAQFGATGGMPPKPKAVADLAPFLEQVLRTRKVLLGALERQTPAGGGRQFNWRIWRESLGKITNTRPEVFDWALRFLEADGLAKSLPGGLVELTEGDETERTDSLKERDLPPRGSS